MTFPAVNGTTLGNDLSYLLVYANTVTNNLFGLLLVVSFYLVVLISSIMMQLRFTSGIRPETSFLASSFATLGFATILQMVSGILNPIYFFVLIGITFLSFMWVAIKTG